MKRSAEWMYELLPAIYRIRDAQQGEPLRGLFGALSEQAEILEKDIAQLYENWFIETCEDWVVPYLGDLLGVRGLHSIPAANFTLRPYVANTLAYRRRKGTAPVLEELARDTTGWTARAVEFFQLLATTQFMNHIRLGHPGTPDLRDADALELLGGPFESAPRSVEVRRIASGRGRYNIPNVGLYLWRLQSYPVSRVAARRMIGGPRRRFTFSPLGNDLPLFNRPQTETEITHLAEEINVPGRLRRRPLFAELDARRKALEDKKTPQAEYFGEEPAFEVWIGTAVKPLPPEALMVCDLSGWEKDDWTPPKAQSYLDSNASPKKPRHTRVAVDPMLGRIVLLRGRADTLVETNHSYGFSADVGGGPYNRQGSLPEDTKDVGQAQSGDNDASNRPWQAGVGKDAAAVDLKPVFETLQEAVDAWNALPAGKIGLITLMDSRTYKEDLAIKIPPGSQLTIVAGDWPVSVDAATGKKRRINGQVVADDLRPHLQGHITVRGTATEDDTNHGQLILNGLLIEGHLTVRTGRLGSLQVVHCTLVPGRNLKQGQPAKPAEPSLAVGSKNSRLRVQIDHSIVGRLKLPEEIVELAVRDSIVQGAIQHSTIPPDKEGSKGPPTVLERTTVFGAVYVKELEASEVIFTEKVVAERRQSGCIRFSYVPEDSQTPRHYRCQPDLALLEEAQSRGKSSIDDLSSMDAQSVRERLTPQFVSETYGTPAYAQLSANCALQIRTGAEDGSEMGVFSLLRQPQRVANLRAALDEYLRAGLEAGILFVT